MMKFIFLEIFSNICYYVWACISYTVMIPFAIGGLGTVYLRKLFGKVTILSSKLLIVPKTIGHLLIKGL
jgi:hypothetical protein